MKDRRRKGGLETGFEEEDEELEEDSDEGDESKDGIDDMFEAPAATVQ